MLTVREFVSSVYGAVLLARFDARGMGFFETSPGGFWRSFYAAVLLAPLYSMVMLAHLAEGTGGEFGLRFVVAVASAYVIHWVAFPLLMVTVCRQIDREQHYRPYVVALNWCALLQNAVFLPLTLLAVKGALGPAAGLLGGAAFIFILAYDWFVTRTALRIGGPAAAMLVLLAVGVDVLISATLDGLLQA